MRTDAQTAKDAPVKLYLRLNREQMSPVQDLLSAMKGGIPVFINLPQEGITLLSPRSMWVENAARAREVLTPLIQAENIKIVEKA